MSDKTKELKILFCPAHFRFTNNVGSEFYSVYNLVNRIAVMFPESVVVTGKSDILNADYRIIETQKKENKNWMLDLSRWSTQSSILFALSYTFAGLRALRFGQFDIIHHVRPFAIGSTFNFLPFLPRYRKMPFIIGEFCLGYSSISLEGEQKFSVSESLVRILVSIIKPVLYYFSITTLKRADAILVTDKGTRGALIAKTISPGKIFIVPHGKDKTEYSFNKEKFNDKEIRILVAGRLIPRKRVDLALHAFKKLLVDNSNVILEIAGDGPEENRLKKIAEEIGIGSKVKFLGAVPYGDMPRVFSRAHIFFHTASAEVFGQVYIEALASGVPIITTSTTGAQDIVKEAFGFTVEDNPLTLGKALSLLVGDKDKLIKMSTSAREEFIKMYDLDSVIVPQVIDIYEKIIHSKLIKENSGIK